jgi:predicted MFS family arabinose efflux permease
MPDSIQVKVKLPNLEDISHAHDIQVPGVRYPNIAIRVLVMALLFFCVFGPSMGYALVGALSQRIMQDYGINSEQLGILFSVYSLPNIFAVFFAGMLIDKIGVNIVCGVCTLLFVGGNMITIGNNYWFMLAGRIIYGMFSIVIFITCRNWS